MKQRLELLVALFVNAFPQAPVSLQGTRITAYLEGS